MLLVGLTYGSVEASLQLPDYMAKIINDGIVAAVCVHAGETQTAAASTAATRIFGECR